MRKTFAIAALLAATASVPALAEQAVTRDVDRMEHRAERRAERESGGGEMRVREQSATQSTPQPSAPVFQPQQPQQQVQVAPQQQRNGGNGGGYRQWNRTPQAGQPATSPVVVERRFDGQRRAEGDRGRFGRQQFGQHDLRPEGNRDRRIEGQVEGLDQRSDDRRDRRIEGRVESHDRGGEGHRFVDNGRRFDNNNRFDNDHRFGDNNRFDTNNRFDNNYRGFNNTRRFDNRRGFEADRRQGSWNRDWRRDQRFNWQTYRTSNRDLFRGRHYYAPYGWNYGYRRFSIGITLNNLLFDQQYWIDDPYTYRLPPVDGRYRWVRYYDDVLLVDVRTGQVVDAIYDFFW